MSKIFGYYEDKGNGIGVKHTWYDSSNVKYSECVDENNKLKTLKVVFSNGTQYQYNNVDVRDFLLFENDSSQAVKWYKLAAEQGIDEAKEALEKLKKQ